MKKIAYLVNKYPKVSHSFIRREIAAIEASGICVLRFSVRGCASELVDSEDRLELERTRIILDVGMLGLLWNLFQVAFQRPIRWFRSLKLALRVGWGSQRGVLFHLAYLAEACVLLRWLLEDSQVTHLHAHFGTNSTTVAMLCHVLGGPSYSFTVHGPEEFDNVESLSIGEKINHAKFVVAISSFGSSQLYRWCDRHQWSKIHVVRCGVDNNFFHQPPTPIPSEPNLTCIGRLCEQKGQLLLLQAVGQLVAEGLRFNLTLVGDGDLRSEIDYLIRDYGLQKHVKITGWASGAEVREYILNSRAIVQPSFAEGLPVVIMEAFALKRPVLSTYIAGIPELVNSGVNGWLIPSGSVEDLKAMIRQVLQTPTSELERMGEAGMTSVKEKHDVENEARKLATLFGYIPQHWPVTPYELEHVSK